MLVDDGKLRTTRTEIETANRRLLLQKNNRKRIVYEEIKDLGRERDFMNMDFLKAKYE